MLTEKKYDMFLNEQVQKYINDPNTKVHIIYGDEAGIFQYSVEVIDSGGFWLNSFDTEQEALNYIKENNLSMETYYDECF